jgi:hypothetical protein
VALSAGVALGGCGTGGSGNSSAAGAPVKREPGSWSTKIDITKLEGKDVKPGEREQAQALFGMMSAISVCMTPEAIAQEDISSNLENSAGSKDCTFDRKTVSGSTVDFSGICKRDGKNVRMSAKGSNGATEQDITVSVEPLDAAGKPEGIMEMHVTSKHNGPCKPGDITPPPKAPAGAPKEAPKP